MRRLSLCAVCPTCSHLAAQHTAYSHIPAQPTIPCTPTDTHTGSHCPVRLHTCPRAVETKGTPPKGTASLLSSRALPNTFFIHLSSGFCSLRTRVNTGVIRNRGKAYVSDMIPRDTQNYSYEGGRPKGRSHSSHICSPGQTLLDNANLTLQGISLWCIISHQGKI